MVFPGNSSSSICETLVDPCTRWCESGAAICKSIETDSSTGSRMLTISLLSIGAVLVIKGTAHGIVVMKLLTHCGCRKTPQSENYRSLQTENDLCESIEQPRRWYNTTLSVISHTFKTFASYAFGSLPIITGLILYQTPSNYCFEATECPSYGESCVSGCYWAEAWLVEVIQKIVQGQFNG
jgi:hypothetical protein